jgi:hypothetical protein
MHKSIKDFMTKTFDAETLDLLYQLVDAIRERGVWAACSAGVG